MSTNTLTARLVDYSVRAAHLDAERSELAAQLKDVVAREVIPQVQRELPDGYGIDESGSRIAPSSSGPAGSIPLGFEVHLRLLHQGKPIHQPDLIYPAQQKLEVRLLSLGHDYGVSIYIRGEEIQIP